MEDWSVTIEKVKAICEDGDSQEALGLLEKLITLSLDLNVRQSCQGRHIELLKKLASCHATWLLQLALDQPVDQLTIPLFKLLRNLCAEAPANQTLIGEENFLSLTTKVVGVSCVNEVGRERRPDQLFLLKVCIQLLGNCCVNNQFAQNHVWRMCYPDIFRSLTSDANPDVVNLTCMVLHSCLRNNSYRLKMLVEKQTYENIIQINPGGQIVSNILVSMKTTGNSEWMFFIMEVLLLGLELKSLLDALHDNSHKIALLEHVLSLANTDKGAKTDVFFTVMLSCNHMEYLEMTYHNSVSSQLSQLLAPLLTRHPEGKATILEGDEFFPRMLALTVQILCQCSCHFDLLKKMQGNPTLLETSVDLLRALSEIDGSSVSAHNISRLSQDQGSCIPQSLHGLKKDLVQLIGNLCYKCKQNQDNMNKHIPLLLNQCTIDHSNPYITQWTVWAIRNVCEGHSANQDVIGQLQIKNVVNMEELQNNFGCEVEIGKDGKLKMKRK